MWLAATASSVFSAPLEGRGGQLEVAGRDLFGDLIGASQWRIYQGVAKEFVSATSDRFP